ncbi:DUF4267 domain-containing protein [Cohnella sp. AR92]|uniref:DUF4267 domain-containing protein n=1 Tax=Cohnella sp. AR92 TaxID=648716 RepID=UPI000F8D71F1|nr:DUF4267 domain-containing protein [Cohnella sp. AR92]RUS48906.1 DUF4267 domain-containing protein [Cohnella sp. AR92]
MGKSEWGVKSATFWMVGVITLLMLYLGIRGFLQPEAAIRGYGIPLQDTADKSLVYVKADRDLFIGIFLLVLMIFRMRKALLIGMLTSTIMPILDAALVLTYATDKTPSWIHIVSAVYGFVISWLLYREERHARTTANSVSLPGHS